MPQNSQKTENALQHQTVSPCWNTETEKGERGVDGMILNRVIFIKIFTWQQCEWWDELKMLKCCIHLPALAGRARPPPTPSLSKLLNQPLWSPLTRSASADIKFVILEYKLPLLLRTPPLSHSFPPRYSFIVCLCLRVDQYRGRAETLLCALDVPH